MRLLKTALRSFILRITIGAGCFVSAYAALLYISSSFRYYYNAFVANRLFSLPNFAIRKIMIVTADKSDYTFTTAPNTALLVFIILFILYTLLYISNADRLKSKRFYKTHYAVIAALTIAASVFSYLMLLSDKTKITMLVFPSIAALCILILWAATVVRLAPLLMKRFFLRRFFNVYSLNTPVGILFFIAIILNTMLFLLSFFVIPMWIALIMAFNITAVLLASLFTLRLSERYRLSNETQLKAERFKSELITNVSHDIRTPLTSIINYVDLMRKLPERDPQMAQYLEVVDRKSARLKLLIADLLEASKASTGNLQVNIAPLDLQELLGQISGDFDEAFSQKGLLFLVRNAEVQNADAPVFIMADGEHLRRVLENLFGNAQKYSQPNTRVYADIAAGNGVVTLSLKNISAEPLGLPVEMLTEQFIQGDRSRTTEGNGLGLYIAKNLMELMNGSLEIAVAGDLFEVRIGLPRVAGD